MHWTESGKKSTPVPEPSLLRSGLLRRVTLVLTPGTKGPENGPVVERVGPLAGQIPGRQLMRESAGCDLRLLELIDNRVVVAETGPAVEVEII